MPSLLEALEEKYGEIPTVPENSEEQGISVAIYVPPKSPRMIVPSLLVLNDCNISSGGSREALALKCASVEELDLAKNQLNDWSEVFGILQQMPRLKFVNLSFNQLSAPLKASEVNSSIKWQQLTSLVLNCTKINWDSVRQILDCFPNLQELHLSLNDFTDVQLSNGDDHKRCNQYLKNRKLHFTGNPITKWAEICKLDEAFPNLESLVLAECPIESLQQPDCPQGYTDSANSHHRFNHLKFLNLNSTKLSTWDDIDRLSQFPALHSVRVQGCPLWESHEHCEEERRHLIIARLPNVNVLNGGGVISSDEREEAEKAFIRYYMKKPEDVRPARYWELVAVYGELDPLTSVKVQEEEA